MPACRRKTPASSSRASRHRTNRWSSCPAAITRLNWRTPMMRGLPPSSASSIVRQSGVRLPALAVAVALLTSVPGMRAAAQDQDKIPGTFSILGFDPETGEIGAAVQSCVFSAGNGPLWAEAGVGAVATQAIVDVSYGPQGLELLRKG